MLDPGAMRKTFVESLSGFPGMEISRDSRGYQNNAMGMTTGQMGQNHPKPTSFPQCQGHGECCTTCWTTLAQQLDKWTMLHAVGQSRSVSFRCFCFGPRFSPSKYGCSFWPTLFILGAWRLCGCETVTGFEQLRRLRNLR